MNYTLLLKSTMLILIASCHQKKHFATAEELPATGIIAISGDTVLAKLNFGSKLILTENGGESWEDITNKEVEFFDFTVDEKGNVWAFLIRDIDSLKRYAKLYKSSDLGRNWKTKEFATYNIYKEAFFPSSIFSKSHESFKMLSWDNKIFHIEEDNNGYSFTYLDSLKSNDARMHWVDQNYKLVFANSTMILFKLNPISGKEDSITQIDDLSLCPQFLKQQDSVYITGLFDSSHKTFFAAVINDKPLKKYSLDLGCPFQITVDLKNRVWICGDSGIFIKHAEQFIRKY